MWPVDALAPAWTRRSTLRYALRALHGHMLAGQLARVSLLVRAREDVSGMVALPSWIDPDRAQEHGLDIVTLQGPLSGALLTHERSSDLLVVTADTLLFDGPSPADVMTSAYGAVLRFATDDPSVWDGSGA